MPRHCLLLSSVLSVVLLASAFAQADAPKAKRAAKGKGANPEGEPLRRKLPDTVKVERDIVYAKYGDREVLLDLYLPKQPASAKIPCIVVIHGGGWRSGDKTRFAAQAAYLADKGFAAACIGYRLLPEVTFPAPIVDCKAAVRWVRANASKYGIDADRIGATGGSAGGHLTAMLATSYKAKELEGDGGNAGVSSRVQAAVAMATPANMSAFGQRNGQAIDPKLIALISPVTHVDKDSAPILLLHGTKDTLVPMAQSELLLKKYQAAGVSAELVKVPDGIHAFWNGDRWFEDTMARTAKFFAAQFKP
jgi:pectinesterase